MIRYLVISELNGGYTTITNDVHALQETAEHTAQLSESQNVDGIYDEPPYRMIPRTHTLEPALHNEVTLSRDGRQMLNSLHFAILIQH